MVIRKICPTFRESTIWLAPNNEAYIQNRENFTMYYGSDYIQRL